MIISVHSSTKFGAKVATCTTYKKVANKVKRNNKQE